MILAVGSDERTHLTDVVLANLRERGHELVLYGPLAGEAEAWPAVARHVGEAVAAGQADEGILFCWTGTGVTIAANKVPGIRAALCDEAETARGARLWNRANVLTLSLRRLSEVKAAEVLETWFSTAYAPNETDDACLAEVARLEADYGAQAPDGRKKKVVPAGRGR